VEPAVRGRILIVDDEDMIRSIMVQILREHDTVQASSGAQAKEILERDQSFDLILCDMMMSNVSGLELHEWLTEKHPRLARQFIFITGGAFTPKTREYLRKIDNIRLDKPFDMTNFRKIVNESILAHRTKSGMD
jgi:DNA-binding NtrC family response regulator